MSQNPRRPTRRIMGPQSALTDYLASHNISASRIAADADARRAAATQARQQAEGDAEETVLPSRTAQPAQSTPTAAEDPQGNKDKRKKEQLAIAKIKQSKKFKKRKRIADSDAEDDDIARAIFESTSAPLPGQMENCAICEKRFTVTPYSRAGPDGGLLCTKCSKELDAEEKTPKKQKKKPRTSNGPVGTRRKMQSEILDGTFQLGAKNLVTVCVKQLSKNIEQAEDFGDLPDQVVDKIARILSKRRNLTPHTLNLFLRPKTEDIKIYDGANISSDDLVRLFQTLPNLKTFMMRNAIQFKDEVMDFLLTRDLNLEGFYLHGANLLSDEKWTKFLKQKGSHLKFLKIYFTDKHVTDGLMESMAKFCPSLQRLKICHNQQVTGQGVKHLYKLKNLEHISLHLQNTVHADVYVNLLRRIGSDLKTLSLTDVPHLDNSVLDAIHANCRSLKKLRITESSEMTDEGFTRLFDGWANPPLRFIDFEKCRQLDSGQARKNPDNIGLCSNGFRAMMAHSGHQLRHLNVHACRHISREAFEEVFSPEKEYPELVKMEISFCEEVTDFVAGSIFRSCPNLRELIVFGCFKSKSVRVPRGKMLVGLPNAMGMQIEGIDDSD